MLCHDFREISGKLLLWPQFIFWFNYDNNVKIWRVKLCLQKQLIPKIAKLLEKRFKK